MKKLILMTVAIVISSCTVANASSNSKHSLSSLSSAFKSSSTIVPKVDPNDITMGYAGQDVSHNVTAVQPIAA